MFLRAQEAFQQPSDEDFYESRERLGEVEASWSTWVRTMFSEYLTGSDGLFIDFAEEHADLWEWIWSIRRGKRVPPFVGIWPRGFAKSTTGEMGTCALGARRVRTYGLYVCETQDQADDHVKNVQEMLEGVTLGSYYPDLGRPRLNKEGHSDGWRRNRLRTASGFTIDAMGFDSSRRGAKVGKDRPDFIVLDDLDGEHDTPDTTRKKIQTLTEKILPSGADGVAVLAIQNKVHDNSIFARLADGRADFLADRIVSGPAKAVDDLEYEQREGRFIITSGTARWEGMDLRRCQEIVDTEGISAFLKERQNETQEVSGGMFDHIAYRRCDWADVPWGEIERLVVWVDPAVTNTDESDAHGIIADSITSNGTIYRLFSWEDRTTPTDALKRAIVKAVQLRAEHVGVETDQGGDTWEPTYREAANELVSVGRIKKSEIPRFTWAKAGSGSGSKVHRASLMLADYETSGSAGGIVHVRGTHTALESGLRRFPKAKPFDLVDAAYWSWDDLRNGTKKGSARNLMKPSELGTIRGTVF